MKHLAVLVGAGLVLACLAGCERQSETSDPIVYDETLDGPFYSADVPADPDIMADQAALSRRTPASGGALTPPALTPPEPTTSEAEPTTLPAEPSDGPGAAPPVPPVPAVPAGPAATP